MQSLVELLETSVVSSPVVASQFPSGSTIVGFKEELNDTDVVAIVVSSKITKTAILRSQT